MALNPKKQLAAELRRLTQARERSMQRRIGLLNQLHCLAYLLFPELLQVMKNIKTKTAQYVLEHYPTPQGLVECGLGKLTNILKKVSRGKIGKVCAKTLYEAASTSVGIIEGQKSIALEIREILAHITAGEKFIASIEEEMSKEVPYSRSILSIKGIGAITVAGLIGEVGDFSKFSTIAEIEKLAGLDLFEISSGKHKGTRRISKRGRSLMRKLLFFASINVVRKGGVLHETYQRLLNPKKAVEHLFNEQSL